MNMTWIRRSLWTSSLAVAVACGQSDQNDPDGGSSTTAAGLAGLALSAPIPASGEAHSLAAEVVFVSAGPGTRAGATHASIANARIGVQFDVLVLDGGFDPVPIPAMAGDRLTVTLLDQAGSKTELVAAARRPAPPRVVRTSPRSGRADVPLNSIIEVVFSAPMDPSTVEHGVQLAQAGRSVAGEVRVRRDGLLVEFVPAQALDLQTDYDLQIASTVRDVLGQALGGEYRLSFRTGTNASAADDIEQVVVVPGRSGSYSSFLPYALHPGDTIRLVAKAFGLRPLEGYTSPQFVEVPLTAEWQLSNATVARVIQASSDEITFVAQAAGTAEVRASAGAQSGAWRVQVFERMSDGMLAGRRFFVLRGWGDGEVRREDVNGAGSELLTAAGPALTCSLCRYYSLIPGPNYADWSYAAAFGAGRVAARQAEGLLVTDQAGGVLRSLVATGDLGCPSWSPDGRRVAYMEQTYPVPQLYVAEADGSGITRLSWSSGFVPGCPVWRPDGTELLVSTFGISSGPWIVASASNTYLDTYAVPIDGSARSRLFGGLLAGPIADDGQSMLVVDDAGDVHRATPGGASLARIAHVGRYRPVAWSADGSLIAMPLYVMSVDGRYARNISQGTEILGFAP
jgi:hypothetical protein